jgi:6-hydroxycyclohex-1-ene-1-carbonyl-CoA dehydrogenase
MKAAVFNESGKPLNVRDWDIPEIGDCDVLVRVEACGVCHTDLHYIDHGVPTFKKPPLILGHETSGVVERKGDKVEDLSEGDKVLLPAVLTCGGCSMCRSGRENICEKMVMYGNHIDGAYAEYVKAPAKDVFRLPKEIPIKEGCIIADAVTTPYHAVYNRAGVRPGDTVAVFGCGGVGINTVQMCRSAGASVIAVDISEKKLEWAREFGAIEVVNPKSEDPAKRIKKLSLGGVDISFEVIGNPDAIRQAFDSLRPGGRLCVVGYSAKDASISAAKLMFREMDIVGSLGCRPVDYPRVIEMAKQGKIELKRQVTHRFELQQINEALQLLRSGEALRIIVIP